MREVHPAAALFPLIEGEEFNLLVASIKDRGLDIRRSHEVDRIWWKS